MTSRLSPRAARRLAAVLIVVLTVGGALAGWAIGRSQPTEYEASTSVLVRFWTVESYLLTGQSNPVTTADISSAALFASSDEVLDRAAEVLADGRSADELDVSVTPLVDANAVQILATAEDPAVAQETSSRVAATMVAALQDRIVQAAAGLTTTTDGQEAADVSLITAVQQRVQALTQGVQPLVPLSTSVPEKTSPTGQLPWVLGILGLAAGVLVAIGLLFGRPAVNRARDAQRLLGVPAVSSSGRDGEEDASRLVRRLLDSRPEGRVLVLPVDASAEKAARAFVERAKSRSSDSTEEARIEWFQEPAGAVLVPRPVAGEVAAVLLLVPQGFPRRALSDAAALLENWHRADAVVVTA